MSPRNWLKQLTARQWLAIFAVVAALAGLTYAYSRIDLGPLHERAARTNGFAVAGLITVLPLLGFPVSILHVVAGVRFGVQTGLLIVVFSIGFQLLASYGLVTWWRGHFARRFASLRARLPRGAHGPVSLFTLLLPGVPYFAKNYVLPLIGVPLGPYFVWCWPLHSVRALMGVVFGDQSDHLTPWKIAGFVAYAAIIALSCAWAFRRLKGLVANPPPAEGGPTPVGSENSAGR